MTLEATETGIISMIAANAWLNFFLGISLQPLFDMINSLQFTALLPLTSITLPSTTTALFEILLSIVSFDFWPLPDPGYTETEPYNEKLDSFGIDNTNFVMGLGGFLIYCIILVIF